MKKIILSNNHKRVIAASLTQIENLLIDLDLMLSNPNDKIMTTISGYFSPNEVNYYKNIIFQAKNLIADLKEKYDLQNNTYHINQIINSTKSILWEIANETKSAKLLRYGALDITSAFEIDSDMDSLLTITESL